MQLPELLNSLAYDVSPNYLTGKRLSADPTYGHIFRRAEKECGLHGVYSITGSQFGGGRGSIPFVYVCQVHSEAEARGVHQKVWNQNTTPFLVVVSPATVRVYPGFRYERSAKDDPNAGALPNSLNALAALSIDSGAVWKQLGSEITPDRRVDWKLLDNLRELDRFLTKDGVEDPRVSHAMIGKLVYLWYLRQRDILSDARLKQWDIAPAHVFTGQVRMASFIQLVEKVDEWLNGSVFPLSSSTIRQFGAERLRKVVSVFKGEQVASSQLPLFDIYDFSFIPIETLSVIYEMFLHEVKLPSGVSKGKDRGAYYTPVPLVNFVLDQIDTRKPLQQGMRVFDGSCGSGAFLVQCYRKLIERQLAQRESLTPVELRDLLTKHIFGADIDEGACAIAELSLALTLLEYVDPPDLTKTRFQLPNLRDRNIFCENAFDETAQWAEMARHRPFDWVVGNPPWKEIKPARAEPEDQVAWAWIQSTKGEKPVGGNQLAEAFAWRAAEALSPDGVGALVLPAMTLFKNESIGFRKAFFRDHTVLTVGNFANLADVLFAGRSRLPAATLVFARRMPEVSDQTLTVFSPFVASQPASLSAGQGQREVWNLVIDGADVRELSYRDILDGSLLPWKLAMWGSTLDSQILKRTARRFKTLGDLEDEGLIFASQGPELRGDNTSEETEHHPELAGRQTVDVNRLKNRRCLIRFPAESLRPLGCEKVFLRKRAGLAGSSISNPPLVVVGASRNFAVFSDEFLLVPARQIGIRSTNDDSALLKALALYLNSDFVTYHQFLNSTEAGVQKTRSTLATLRLLPTPFTPSTLEPWVELHARIAFKVHSDDFAGTAFQQALNDLTFEALKLDRRSRAAVLDLVRIRMKFVQGKVDKVALLNPTHAQLLEYVQALRDELDDFVRESSSIRHQVEILQSPDSGLVSISLDRQSLKAIKPTIVQSSAREANTLKEARAALLEQKAQWVYFQRNLIAYEGNTTYLLKPANRLYWTVSEAIRDAGTIIADAIATHEPALLQSGAN